MKTQNFLFGGDEESPDYLDSKSEDEKNAPFENDTNQSKKGNTQKNNIDQNKKSNMISNNKSISDENDDLDHNFKKISSDLSLQISELKSKIDSRNQQFETEFAELKRMHQAKLKNIKQNNITREQTKSDEYDLEYRNLIWTTTLKHLDRGCFTDDLRLLFQQAISDEQYRLEKEIIKIKEQNEEEIQNLKENLPKMHLRNKSKVNHLNLDIMDPIEMARIIYNNCFSDSDVDDFSEYEMQLIDKLIRKIQRDTMKVSSFLMKNRNKPLKQKSDNVMRQSPEKSQMSKGKRSPKLKKNDKYMYYIRTHQEACQGLEKSVQETDQFIKQLKEKKYFNEMFPHVD